MTAWLSGVLVLRQLGCRVRVLGSVPGSANFLIDVLVGDVRRNMKKLQSLPGLDPGTSRFGNRDLCHSATRCMCDVLCVLFGVLCCFAVCLLGFVVALSHRVKNLLF